MARNPPSPTLSDTIAAVATAAGRGGIGIVRVSGPKLAGFAERLSNKSPRPRHATYATFFDAAGAPIDRGILLYFDGPHSFTGEDVLEAQGHGGPLVLQVLLARCIELGARLAEPGEFTRRAYLNDKLDLAQAEAVADLIDASTAQAARAAMRSLSGEFSQAVHALVRQLIDLRLLIEATLDFPEDELDVIRDGNVEPRLLELGSELAALCDRATQGSVLRAGLHVVLAGAPNVGKSSLLNRLAGIERAIVTPVAGTTRDTIGETIQIDGVPVHVVDTAGLRDTEDLVEQQGVERSWREIERADVVVLIQDATTGATTADAAIAARLPVAGERIVVNNKCDLLDLVPARRVLERNVELTLSAKTGAGLDLLRAELLRVAGWHGHGEDAILARARHLTALAEAAVHLREAAAQLSRLELCAEELRLAQESLGSITGEFTADDLLGEIFSRFCLGK